MSIHNELRELCDQYNIVLLAITISGLCWLLENGDYIYILRILQAINFHSFKIEEYVKYVGRITYVVVVATIVVVASNGYYSIVVLATRSISAR